MFQKNHPLAWLFHRNTSRWPFNLQAPPAEPTTEAPFKEYLDAPLVPLPAPGLPPITLATALAERVSCRAFTDAPLSLGALSTLLKLSYGVRDAFAMGGIEFLERPVPSGGGLYPLELYLLVRRVAEIAPGIYHYAAQHHGLEQISAGELHAPFVADLFMGQPYVAQAGLVVLLTAVPERSLWKYKDRGYRYMLLEAGHVAQNLNLVAAALTIGALNLGGFFDAQVAALLGLDLDAEIPLYGIAIGHPAATDHHRLRQPGY